MSWPTLQLSELGRVVTGSTPKSSDTMAFGDEIPFVTPGDLDNQNPLIYSERYLTLEAASKARILPSDSVLVSCIGNLGKIAISGRPVVSNQQINAVVFDETKVFPKFGFYACRLLKPVLDSMAPATTLPIVSKSKFEALKIPVPPLDEQRRIAAILDQAEELRAKRRAAIALLDQLPQAIFLEMFGDPATNPKALPMVRIGDLLESANYGTSGKAGPIGEWPVLRMGNLTSEGHLDLRELKYMDLSDLEVPKYTVRKGDILFNRTNSADLVGKTALYSHDEPVAFAGYLVRLRVNEKATPEFVAAFMNLGYTKKVLRSMAKSIVGMANINAKEVQTIDLPHPPIELQHKFAERVAAISRAKTPHQTAIAELDALFASLQAKVFGRSI